MSCHLLVKYCITSIFNFTLFVVVVMCREARSLTFSSSFSSLSFLPVPSHCTPFIRSMLAISGTLCGSLDASKSSSAHDGVDGGVPDGDPKVSPSLLVAVSFIFSAISVIRTPSIWPG